MTNEERCDNCRFIGYGYETGQYYCRRYPRVGITQILDSGFLGISNINSFSYPLTDRLSWCGEWQAKEEGIE